MNRRMLATWLLAVLGFGPVLIAHEGHDHKIMGTVAVVHEKHLDVKTKDEKQVAVTLDESTKIRRGTAKATVADLRVGERVVVTVASGEEPPVAKEIRLAASKG